MSRKPSMMGSSRFEFNNDLDSRAAERKAIYDNAFEQVWMNIEYVIQTHVKGDLVTRDSLTDWLGQQITLKFIERRGEGGTEG